MLLTKTQIDDPPAFENDALTDEEIAFGFYSFADLKARGLVRDRSDLLRKQQLSAFPRPVKLGKKQAGFLRTKVHNWVRNRAISRTIQPAE